ncbi:hypothetical protein K8T06_02675, partial [bacterium]|nr:hypothetical protein [bacterium]
IAGDSGTEYCTLVYKDPFSSAVTSLSCHMAIATDWGIDIWASVIASFGTVSPSGTSVLGPNAAFDSDNETLYVVWADDRSTYHEVYGVISYDAGVWFQSEQQLTNNGQTLIEAPVIVTGTESGNLAIAYTRNTSTGDSPYVLVSMPAFFDKCDTDPGNYWDSYAGVSVDSTTIPPFSMPACYRLETASTKGQLINQYTVEQEGGIDLYFYDDTTITTENFFVALENTNAKGVIRMLGVRNETTQSNYAYSADGVNWTDWGVPRSTGWHHITMTTSEAVGLEMSIEYSPGLTAHYADPAFQYFTKITIEGGDTGDPYFVDDIEVHAISTLDERPIPTSSHFSLALLMIIMSVLVVLYSRR